MMEGEQEASKPEAGQAQETQVQAGIDLRAAEADKGREEEKDKEEPELQGELEGFKK